MSGPAAHHQPLKGSRWWQFFAVASLLASGLGVSQSGMAQVSALQNVTTRSSSGQFIALAKPYLRSSRAALAAVATEDTGYLRLDPTVLTISAERIRQAVLRELQAPGEWKGKIYLRLRPAETTADRVVVSAERFKDGWQYAVDIPEVVESWRYVQALTHCLLLELANRTANQRSSEIPSWLVDSLAARLLATSEAQILLSAPGYSRNTSTLTTRLVDAKRDDPLKEAHKALAKRPALTYQQLSWPAPDLSAADAQHYRYSALFFLDQLLRLKDGRHRLVLFLSDLPNFYNWQMAFLKAFDSYFKRPLDIEKWWALQTVHFSGREQGEIWPLSESLAQLEEVLAPAVDIYATSNSLPTQSRVTLQTIVREWKPGDRSAALERKIVELEMLRIRFAPELVPMLDNYHRALRYFLVEEDRIHAPRPHQEEAARKRLVIDTVRQLDQLDALRRTLKPAQPG